MILLHVASFLSPKVEIPQLNFQTAKKLTPVTLVNVIGLVFNILCLRGVEASFFQVSFNHFHLHDHLIHPLATDCSRNGFALDYRSVLLSHPQYPLSPSDIRRRNSHHGLPSRRGSQIG